MEQIQRRRRSIPHVARLFAPLTLLALVIVLASCGAPATATSQAAASNAIDTNAATAQPAAGTSGATLRIGYQKGGTLPILKAQGNLEKRLAPLGVKVTWTEFPAGPPLLEGLNTGSIDIGSTGQAPPVFAQAAGTPLVYIASQAGSPIGQALLVPKTSPIKDITQLKGKKVAFAKGSSAHYFIIQALAAAGMQYSDIQPVFLTPPDARPAFEGGSVDAWVIWEPYLTVAEQALQPRVLNDGSHLPPARSYYLASRTFADQHADLTNIALDEIQKVEQWSMTRPKEVAQALAPIVGIDAPTLEIVANKSSYGLEPLNDKVVAEQQSVADTFFRLKLIPKQITISDAIWHWQK